MRASTAVAILFAAAAASPSLAAPHYARSNAAELLLARQNGHVARSEPVYNVAREVEDLMAREDIHDLLARQNIDPTDASGAGIFSIITKLAGPLLGGIFGGGSNNNRREIEEFFAREDVVELLARQNIDPNDASGASFLSTLGSIFSGIFGKRDLEMMELLARQQVDESGASIITDFLQKLFPNIHRREIEELVARQNIDPTDASGAGIFSIITKLAGPLLGGIFGGGSSNNRREIEEFFAREDVLELLARQSIDPNDASGASFLSTLGSIFGGIFGKRDLEMMELLARQSVDPNDASGAGIFSILGKLVGPVLGGIFGGGSSNNRREIEEFFAREDVLELLARQNIDPNDASGASFLSTLGSIFGGIFGKRDLEMMELLARQSVDPNDASGASIFSILGKLVGPVLGGILGGGSSNNRREIEEFFAREDVLELLARQNIDPNDASGAGLLSFLGPLIGGIFGGSKRELVELMARQNIDPNDASGAGLLSFLGPLIGGIFGGGNKRELLEVFARELENSARSLNALD